MKLLLDTHAFLWWNEASSQLSRRVLDLLSDPGNTLFLSIVSVWEIVLKVQTGKLKLPAAASVYVRARLHYYGIRPLSVTLAHVFAVEALPPHHRDPFDRMSIAQGQAEGLAIVTHDPQIGQYSVETIW